MKNAKQTIFLFFLIAITSLATAQRVDINELAQSYAQARLNSDAESILSLYYPAWEECRSPEYNSLISDEIITNKSNHPVLENYRVELKPLENSNNYFSNSSLLFTGIWSHPNTFYDDILYFPITPTHTLNLLKNNEKYPLSISLPVKNIQGNWYIIHKCAGNGSQKFFHRKQEILRVNNESKKIYHELYQLNPTKYCETDRECESMPVGSRPCGGPHSYIVYSTAIDRDLEEKLINLSNKTKEIDRKQNQLNGTAGTCDYHLPKVLICTNNICTETDKVIFP